MNYIENDYKEIVDNKVEEVFKTLLKITNIENSIKVVSGLGLPYSIQENEIIFELQGYKDAIVFKDNKSIEKVKSKILDRFLVKDKSIVLDYIKHNYSQHLEDKIKSGLGKYYTPENLVRIVFDMVDPYVDDETIVADLAAGCGAFLDRERFNNILCRDIDEQAASVLRILGFENSGCDNTLANVNREKYLIKDEDKLVLIGNPPYNDTTSKNKKQGKNAKKKIKLMMDDDIKARDYGISFLKAYAKLSPKAICVLHPLSYLIKETNFNFLKDFAEGYKLQDAVIFSSMEFSDTQKTPFPVTAALYVPGKMNYNHIRDFEFRIKDSVDKFVLSNMTTIDGYIRKYPPKKMDRFPSDIGLYMYNIRDANSLLTSGNLTETVNYNTNITINYKDIYRYAYLNCYKRYFQKNFLFGNLSPLIDINEFEKNKYLRDICLIDTILNNQRLSAFNIDNPDSILFTKGLLKSFEQKHGKFNKRNSLPNCYSIILDFRNNEKTSTDAISVYLTDYFKELGYRMLKGKIKVLCEKRYEQMIIC